jgi:LysM repeat protein
MKLFRALLAFGLGLAAGAVRAQSSGDALALANMQQDVQLLTQRVGELQLRVEQLERQNAALQSQSGASAQTYATVAQLNDAVAALNAGIKDAAATTKTETLDQVGVQLEKLGRQTQAALDALAKNQGGRPASAAASPSGAGFSDDYPKEGVSYTVQKGDTLSSIAKKNGASVRDIVNANKITSPSKVLIGQTLFIPQASASIPPKK